MILVIPTTNTESVYGQTVALDGTDYVLRLRWNARAARWFWRLEDLDGEVLIGDRKLVVGPLLTHLVGAALPPGELWCVTTHGGDPGLDDLGSEAALVYVEEESVA